MSQSSIDQVIASLRKVSSRKADDGELTVMLAKQTQREAGLAADQLELVKRELDALKRVVERVQGDVNWMLNTRQFLSGHVFDYLHEVELG